MFDGESLFLSHWRLPRVQHDRLFDCTLSPQKLDIFSRLYRPSGGSLSSCTIFWGPVHSYFIYNCRIFVANASGGAVKSTGRNVMTN